MIPLIVWSTWLSGSGKSTVANLIEQGLTAEGRHAYILDGDNVRHELNKDMAFTKADRFARPQGALCPRAQGEITNFNRHFLAIRTARVGRDLAARAD